MSELHEMQRTMRAMRRAALGRGVAAVLDVGTSKVACFVLRFEESEGPGLGEVGPMAGQGRVRVLGAAATRSRGVRFGEIATMRETERAIRTVVQSAQRASGERIDHVLACLAGADPRSHGRSGVVMVKGEVTEADVARAMAACAPPAAELGPGRHVLHAQPVRFALDHRAELADPRGQFGQRLFCDMHLMDVEAEAARALVRCVKRCDLELAGLASSAYASGLAALVEDEQELGAACLDMGGGATSVAVFLRRHMVFGGSVRMGGEHVTLDVHKGLGVSLQTAERIKTFYGGVHATGLDDREMIEVGAGTGDWEHDRRSGEPRRAHRHHAPARRGDPRGGARSARRGGLRRAALAQGGAHGRRQPGARARCARAAHPRLPGAPRPAAAAARRACEPHRARLRIAHRALPRRGAAAGRVVGLRRGPGRARGARDRARGALAAPELVEVDGPTQGPARCVGRNAPGGRIGRAARHPSV